MPRNGSGTYVPVSNTWSPAVPGTVIDSGASGWEGQLSDLGAALTQSISKDGQTVQTGPLNFGAFKATNLANGTVATDAATLGQVQANGGSFVAVVGGTGDAITLTPSPAITAYAAGQEFWWIPGASNTTATTVAVSGLASPKAVQGNGAALVSGDIVSGRLTGIKYDGTQFQLIALRAAVSHTADYAAGSVTLAKLDTTGTAGQLLMGVAAASAPAWGPVYTVSTFTPTLTFGGASVGMTFSARTGNYVRIGSIAFWAVEMTLSAKGSSTGNAKIASLPFTAAASAGGTFWPESGMAGLTVGGAVGVNCLGAAASLFQQTAIGYTSLTEANFNNNSVFICSGWLLL